MFTFNKTGWYVEFHPIQSGGAGMADVEAWSDSGVALVVDEDLGVLVPAHERPGFKRLVRCHRIAAVIPAEPGWRVLDNTAATDPIHHVTDIVAWAVDDFGKGYPVRAGQDDLFVEELEHPDQELLSPYDRDHFGDGVTRERVQP